MYTWKNIPPRHDILYAMCQKIFFQYSFDVSKIFHKRFFLAHVHLLTLMLPDSPNNILVHFLVHISKDQYCPFSLPKTCIHFHVHMEMSYCVDDHEKSTIMENGNRKNRKELEVVFLLN